VASRGPLRCRDIAVPSSSRVSAWKPWNAWTTQRSGSLPIPGPNSVGRAHQVSATPPHLRVKRAPAQMRTPGFPIGWRRARAGGCSPVRIDRPALWCPAMGAPPTWIRGCARGARALALARGALAGLRVVRGARAESAFCQSCSPLRCAFCGRVAEDRYLRRRVRIGWSTIPRSALASHLILNESRRTPAAILRGASPVYSTPDGGASRRPCATPA